MSTASSRSNHTGWPLNSSNNGLLSAKTPTSRKPMRSSPLAGPAVVSLNDPAICINPTPNILSHPLSVRLRSKSKSIENLNRPVSLYSYSYAYSPATSHCSGRPPHKRPSTAPGPASAPPSSATNELHSASFIPRGGRKEGCNLDGKPPSSPPCCSVLVSPVELLEPEPETSTDTAVQSRQSGSNGVSALNVNNLASPGHLRVPPVSSGAAATSSARARYSYASTSSAGPSSSRPVSFATDSDADTVEASRAHRPANYRSATSTANSPTPRPISILKHSHTTNRTSSEHSNTPPSQPSSSVSSTPTETEKLENSWYTFSPYATTPKFSRLGLAGSGVVMPVSAKELAKRNSGGVSREGATKVGSVSPALGQTPGRRGPVASVSKPNASGSIPSNRDVAAGKTPTLAPAPEWLAMPPPASGGNHGRSRARTRSVGPGGSLRSLRRTTSQSHAESLSESQSSTPSSSSSRSTTRNSSCSSLSSSWASFGGNGNKSTGKLSISNPTSPSPSSSTIASIPTPVSASSFSSLKKWRSVKDLAQHMPQPGSTSPTSSSSSATDTTLASLVGVESEEVVKPFVSGNDHGTGVPLNDQFQQPTPEPCAPTEIFAEGPIHRSGDNIAPRLKTRSSAFVLLDRVRSWGWSGNLKAGCSRGKEVETKEGVRIQVTERVPTIEGNQATQRKEDAVRVGKSVNGQGEASEGAVVASNGSQPDMTEVPAKTQELAAAAAADDIMKAHLREGKVELQKHNLHCSEVVGEDSAEVDLGLEADGGSLPISLRHYNDQSQKDASEHLGEIGGEGVDCKHGAPEEEAHSELPVSIVATLLVVPVPSPNLHVSASMPCFIRQADSVDTQIDVIKDAKDHQTTDEHHYANVSEASIHDAPTLQASRPEPLMNTTPEKVPAESQRQTGKRTHRENRSGSMRRLLNTMVCGSRAAEEMIAAAMEPAPGMPCKLMEKA